MLTKSMLAAAAFAFLLTGVVQAETKVTLSEMHICCGACVKAVNKAIDSVEGASVEVDKDAGTSTITADDEATAARAVKAVADAGFHGMSDSQVAAMPMDSGAPAGKVERLELTGIHNCCGGCNKALKKALTTVTGVTADNASPKEKVLVVEGEFVAQELIEALYKAGFHGRVKQ
jgi:copper chaperone CopZ